MIDLKNMNENPLSKRWEQRYREQTYEVQKKLDELDEMLVNDYQLKIIKRKRVYPQKGDVFLLNPKGDIYFWGVVINNHINNINGEDLLLVLIFNERTSLDEEKNFVVNVDNLLIKPSIVGKGYWTRGYFYTIDNIDLQGLEIDYGFYDIIDAKYYDEYENEMDHVPKLLGVFGVSTISGIAYNVNWEMIILGIN